MVGTSETGGVAKVYLVYIQVNAVSGSWVVWDQYLAGSAGLGGVAYSPTHYVSGMRG